MTRLEIVHDPCCTVPHSLLPVYPDVDTSQCVTVRYRAVCIMHTDLEKFLSGSFPGQSRGGRVKSEGPKVEAGRAEGLGRVFFCGGAASTLPAS